MYVSDFDIVCLFCEYVYNKGTVEYYSPCKRVLHRVYTIGLVYTHKPPNFGYKTILIFKSMNATNKAGKTAPKQLTEKQILSAENKAYTALVKEGKINLKQESVSVSFWVKHVINSNDKTVKQALKKRLSVKTLPKKDELLKVCIAETLKGFKFYDTETKTIILNCKKTFKKDGNGVTIKEDNKPVVDKTWYEKKDSFTFNAVYTALFTPSKTIVYIKAKDIKEAE